MLWLAIILGCGGEPPEPVGPVSWVLGGPDNEMRIEPSDRWPSIAISPSGSLIAARTVNGGVHVIDNVRRKPVLHIPATRDCGADDCPHTQLVWLDDERLAVLVYGKSMRPWYSIWKVRDKEQISFGDVGDLEAGPYDQAQTWQIALPSAWNTERVPILLDLETGRRYAPKVDVEGLADDQMPFMQRISPDNQSIAWSDHQGFLHLSRSHDGKETKVTRVTPSTTMKVTQVHWSPSGDSVMGVADDDAIIVFNTDLARRFGLNVKHPPKLLHPVDDERVLFWTGAGLFCVNSLNAVVGPGWGKALGPADFSTVGDLTLVNIGGQGVIAVDVAAFCPAKAAEGEAPTSR